MLASKDRISIKIIVATIVITISNVVFVGRKKRTLEAHKTIDLHDFVAQVLVHPVIPESGPQAEVVVARNSKENNILVNTKEEVVVNNRLDILLLFTKAPPH